MIKFITFIPRLVKYRTSRLWSYFQFYAKFSLIPPEGCFFGGLENMKIGNDFGISPFCSLFAQECGDAIHIGNNVKLNFNVMINADAGGEIRIGSDVIIGPGSILRASNHNYSDASVPIIYQGHSGGKIEIESNVWVGANCVILPNVRIGEGAIIAAGAVVNKDVPAGAMFGGVPAKDLKVNQK